MPAVATPHIRHHSPMTITTAPMMRLRVVSSCIATMGTTRKGTGSQPRFLKSTAPMRAAGVCSAALTFWWFGVAEVKEDSGGENQGNLA